MTNLKKQLGERIAYLRKSENYTQEKFAEKICLSTSSLSYIENGKNYPKFETLEKIAKQLNVQYHELYYFNNEKDCNQLYIEIIKKIKHFKTDFNKLKLLSEYIKLI